MFNLFWWKRLFAVAGTAKYVGDFGDLIEAGQIFCAEVVQEFDRGLFGSAMAATFGEKAEEACVEMVGGRGLGAVGFADREWHARAAIDPRNETDGEDQKK